ncbi:response regulator [Arcobacter sp. s6]|uniref:response regulator n=1 Tax=Arcobacter sp. s6 TaxID=3230363 RepID=UPI0034A06C65
MFKFIYKTITNPIIGPVAVSSVILSLLVIFYLPTLSLQNQKDKVVLESLTLIDHLKIFRTYYNEAIVKKLKSKTDIAIDYNHEIASNTIPLPATVIYNLSERLNNERGITVNFFSDYPFPNRQKRILDGHQKESLSYLRKNPSETFVKEDFIDNKKVLRVTVSDVLTSQECLNCHNNRIDTPKNDWKIGEVRGAFEVIMPLEEQFLLNPIQIKLSIAFMILVITSFILHYTILFLRREKEIKSQTALLENEVLKRTKDLNSSNLLLLEYKKAVDSSAIVSKSDLKGNIIYVNDTFCEISGYKREELLSKPHNIVRHPDMPKEFFQELWQTIKAKKIFKGILKNRNKNGQAYYVASTIVPILDDNGDIIEYLSLRYDITELVDAKEKAEIAQKAKSTFLANMSHEIRTPLNAIIGFSDILCESNINIEEKENAKIISRSAKSLLNIINDVLDISKMENGKFELEETEFSLFDLTEHIVELFSVNIKDKDIKFIYKVDPTLPELIISDSFRLQQVLSNFLSNAIKFTPENGRVYFEVKVLEKNNENVKILFLIKDTGIGISKDQEEIIFKPFAQADSGISRKFGGTGLGLAICWDIVSLLNSKIKIKSEINKGSEFSFAVDFRIGTLSEEKIKRSDISFAICDCLDDEDNIKAIVKNYLEKIGTVYDIPEALTQKIDILFCFDINNLLIKLLEFKEYNINSKIVYVGEKRNLDKTVLTYIDYYIDLPIYGSKIYNIIADNSNINRSILDKSSKIQDLQGNILVAEDNLNNQKLIEILLSKLGLQSTIVSNGQEAIDMYKTKQFNLILMDINMPIVDGLNATKLIREIQNDYYKIPIIALTANSIAGDKEKYLSQGMDDYLSKPIDFNSLTNVLKKYLQMDKNKIIIAENELGTKSDDLDEKFNKNIIKERLFLDDLTIDMLLDNFFLTLDGDIKKLQNAINSKNCDEISKIAHYIKGACSNLGMDKCTEILDDIESRAKNLEYNFSLEKLNNLFEKIKKDLQEK